MKYLIRFIIVLIILLIMNIIFSPFIFLFYKINNLIFPNDTIDNILDFIILNLIFLLIILKTLFKK
jgi:hypothetical protein